MAKNNNSNNQWGYLAVGLITGFLAGYLTNQVVQEKVPLTPEQVIEELKKYFVQFGNFKGFWIELQKEKYESEAGPTKVYRGGVTVEKDGHRRHFEFLADAFSGLPLKIKENN